MSFEDEYVRVKKKKSPLRVLFPLFGFIMAIALGAIAYILSPDAHELLIKYVDNFPADEQIQYVVAGVLFVVLVLFAGMIYAMFAPKPPKQVTEKELQRLKDAKEKERRARKRRRRQIYREEREQRRQKQ